MTHHSFNDNVAKGPTDAHSSEEMSVEMVNIRHAARNKNVILCLLSFSFFLVGTFQSYPAWLLPNATILSQTEEERSLSGWLLFAGLFYFGMIGAPLMKKVFSEDVFIIGTFGALPFSYFLIWCSLQGSDNPKTSWIYYFGCLFVGYAVGGCSSIVVSIITPLFGPGGWQWQWPQPKCFSVTEQ